MTVTERIQREVIRELQETLAAEHAELVTTRALLAAAVRYHRSDLRVPRPLLDSYDDYRLMYQGDATGAITVAYVGDWLNGI